MQKRLAVVAGGWHFPLHFYEAMARQQIPDGWSVDLFCISHRDPKYSAEEKKDILPKLGWSYREALDRVLYADFATEEKMRSLGWTYELHPNTIGDWGMTNQWLEGHEYKQYDVILATHDDNLILTDKLFAELLVPEGDWLITTNSAGSDPLSLLERLKRRWSPPVSMRGSFEFFKREALDMIGGKFDLSAVSVTREGEVYSSLDAKTIRDWNNHTRPLKKLLAAKGMRGKVRVLSPYLRVSEHCIEGQRGYISMSQAGQRSLENAGFAFVQKKYERLLPKEWLGVE